MSILIINKAVPKTCEECLFYGIDVESGCFLEKCFVIRKAGQDKPSWCPIVRVVMCKDCKYFEYDHPYIIQGMPILGHEVCNAWGDGCKTDENGYCFMAERREDE